MTPKSILEPFRSAHVPQVNDLLSALQLIAIPAVLIYNPKELIVGGNTEFNKFTGYGSNELTGKPIQVLFPKTARLTDLTSKPLETEISQKGTGKSGCKARLWQLDMEHDWSIVTFISDSTSEDQAKESFHDFFLTVSSLLGNKSGVMNWLKNNLPLFAKLLNCSFINFYIHDRNQKILVRTASSTDKEMLADKFPDSDLNHLSDVFYWEPGKRVLSEIHRQARIQNLSHLVEVPILAEGKVWGLLLMGNIDKKPIPSIQEYLRFFSQLLSSELEKETRQNATVHELFLRDATLDVYSEVLENTQEGVCLLDPAQVVHHINSAAEWMLGYADWEVKNQPVENVLIGPKNLSAILEEAQTGVQIPNIGECSLHHRDGHSFPAQIRIVPILRKEKLSAIIIFFRDITEQEQIIARTQQLEHRALLGDVTSIFAHEVRNPVNNISTGLQLLATRLEPSDPNKDVITRMEGDCSRLNDLMESVLAFSRPIDQKFELVDLAALLQKTIDRWRPRLSNLNIEPYFESEMAKATVMGNIRSLEQVFVNLISNATDAMSKEGGTLAVKITEGPNVGGNPNIDVLISDNGPGIPEEIKKRLFEPFVTNKAHGTGLGLAITKKIVTAHRGNIEVESFPGGTIFHVIIPSSSGDNR
jgi:two-component system sensor histidine kinase AtoS